MDDGVVGMLPGLHFHEYGRFLSIGLPAPEVQVAA
jgi:hypothetical protein